METQAKVVTGLGTLTVAALVAIAAFGGKVDPETKDVKSAADAKRDGDVQPYSVYRMERSDGGSVYASVKRETDAGEKVTFIDRSPCAMRPAKTDPSACLALERDGGVRDPGDENVMQDGQWTGTGCVETACVVMFGETAPGEKR